MEFQEKMLLRFTDLYKKSIDFPKRCRFLKMGLDFPLILIPLQNQNVVLKHQNLTANIFGSEPRPTP